MLQIFLYCLNKLVYLKSAFQDGILLSCNAIVLYIIINYVFQEHIMIAKVGYIEYALEKGFINERPKN